MNGVVTEHIYNTIRETLIAHGYDESGWPGFFTQQAAPAIGFSRDHSPMIVVHNSDMIRQPECLYIAIGLDNMPNDLALHLEDSEATVRDLVDKFARTIRRLAPA